MKKRAIVFLLLWIFLFQNVFGQWTVTSNLDSGAGTLRDLIASAASGDTILFSSLPLVDTVKLSSDEILIDKDLTFIGSESYTVIDGQSTSRLFRISAGYNVAMHNLTLRKGLQNGDSASAVLNKGSLLLENCNILENRTEHGFTSGTHGGAILSTGSLIVKSCTFKANIVYNINLDTFGGAIYNSGVALIYNSVFSGNYTAGKYDPGNGYGGAIYNGSGANITLINCTIAGNDTFWKGGGIYNNPNNSTTSVKISNTIIALNKAPNYPPFNLVGPYTDLGNNFIDGDPHFVQNVPYSGSTMGDLRLKCESLAIDSGNSSQMPEITLDINNNPRRILEIDIGAFEYQGQSILNDFVISSSDTIKADQYIQLNDVSIDPGINSLIIQAGRYIEILPNFQSSINGSATLIIKPGCN